MNSLPLSENAKETLGRFANFTAQNDIPLFDRSFEDNIVKVKRRATTLDNLAPLTAATVAQAFVEAQIMPSYLTSVPQDVLRVRLLQSI